MMGGRRWRRVTPPQTLLPLQRVGARVSHTVSCWYCDIRIIALNRLLYSIGRRQARILRIWYAIGVGFGLLILIGVSLTLLVELVQSLHLGGLNKMRAGVLVSLFFGIGQSYSLSLSVVDAAIMGLSTLVSVIIHELGHALAAARMNLAWRLFKHLDLHGLRFLSWDHILQNVCTLKPIIPLHWNLLHVEGLSFSLVT